MPIAGQTASGNVNPSRFVKKSGSYQVALCGAGEVAFGISEPGTKEAPIPNASAYAAVSGDPINVYGQEENCLLEAGDTVTDGAALKSDSTGRGVAASTGEEYYAIAERGGAVGEKLQVVFRVGILP